MTETINPAECDRTTVYAGEYRNFNGEWISFKSGRRRSPDARDGNTWLVDIAFGSFWVGDDKVRKLVRLVPARTFDSGLRGKVWLCIRDELQREWPAGTEEGQRRTDAAASAAADAVLEYLSSSAAVPSETYFTIRDGQFISTTPNECERELVAAKRTCDELRTLIKGQKEHVSTAQARAQEAEKRAEALDKIGQDWAGMYRVAAKRAEGLERQLADSRVLAEPSWDAEDCDACTEVQDQCRYHRGVDAGVEWISSRISEIAANPELLNLIPKGGDAQ